jgi:hypothetical protein
MNNPLPPGYENELSNYQAVVTDGCCGEPVAWGHRIIRHLGEERFQQLYKYGELKCLDMGEWVLMIKKLTRKEAEEMYGPITEEEFGPRGGWKSTTFGTKKFISKIMKPEK